MATAQPKSGVTEYTTTTGTGALTLTGAAPGFRGFVSADDGLIYHYAIFQDQTTFETGVGTYTHGVRQLSRTTVLSNINGTTTPLNLGAGTKEVSITIPGERVMMADCANQISADQFHNGNEINLDADHDSWMDVSTDDTFKLFLNSALAMQMVSSTGGSSIFSVYDSNTSATEGPLLTTVRASPTPAANDALGTIYAMANVSDLSLQIASKIRTWWTSAIAGAFSSMLEFQVAGSGALQTVLKLLPGIVSVPTGIFLFSGGKTASSLTTVGAELNPNGQIQAVCLDGNTPLHVGRGAGDGTHITLFQNGVSCAAVTTTGATTTWGPFTGSHYGDFQAGVTPEHERVGTVLAGTGKLLAEADEPIYELAPAVNGDRRVLGVWGGRHRTNIMNGEEHNLIIMFAVGNGPIRATGPIAAGDLLCASPIPGIAWAQPNQDQIGPWTVAKATNDSPDDGDERLVSCIYMAG